MLHTFRQLLGLIRFSHTVFALPFALMSALLAWSEEPFRWLDLLGILLCMITARSFAMVVNRVADRRFDALNPRTAGRHLPAGTLSLALVIGFGVACAVLFVASTLLFWFREPSNPWPFYLAGPVLVFIAGYSWTKRVTSLAHFWLGASLMLGPIAAWIAIKGLADLELPSLIGLAVLLWVAGFDMIYACQDQEFDRLIGLHSIPARFGIRGALRIALVCHVLMVGVLVGVAFVSPELGGVYLAGLGVMTLILLYQHWLVRPNDLTRVNQAFFQVNALVSLGLLLLVALEIALD